MPMKTIFSNRIYAKDSEEYAVSLIEDNILLASKILHTTYDTIFNMYYLGFKTPNDISLHKYISAKFPDVGTYYLNSVLPEARGIFDSQRALISEHLDEKKAKLKAIENKIKKEEARLANFEIVKASFIARSKTIKNGQKPHKFKTYSGSNIYEDKNNPFGDNHLLIRRGIGKKAKVEPIGFTEAEFYNQERIRRTKSKLGNLHFRRNRLLDEIEILEKQLSGEIAPKKVCFGSRDFFKTKDTTEINHNDWKEQFDLKRNHNMFMSGRNDAVAGNWAIKYDPDKKLITMKTLNLKKTIVFSDVEFPYSGDELASEIKANKRPISYRLVKKVDKENQVYYIIQATFTLPEKELLANLSNGVIAIDINPDGIAGVDIDDKGRLAKSDFYSFDLRGKTTNQVTDILNEAARVIVAACVGTGKPLVMEKLDFKAKKNALMYEDKAQKHMLTSFAYSHIKNAIHSHAYKKGVAVVEVDPAFTSLLGKIIYMRPLRVPIHVAAALVIGRRAMGFDEKIPRVYQNIKGLDKCKNEYQQYALINKQTKGIPNNCFYKKISDFGQFRKDNKVKFA